MGAAAVCDYIGRFTYFSTRYVDSSHDSSVYKRTFLYTNKDWFFQEDEYLLADVAY
ncbi:hypothetical protein BGZ80_009012, partial [Entomortierella chlamydospora]